MKFAFIHAEKAHFSVAALCRVLGVTRQGYYAFAQRPPSSRVDNDAALHTKVREAFANSAGRYGSPRVLRTLQREGVSASKRRVERAMRAMGLYARRRSRSRVTTTKANPAHRFERNVLARDFTAKRPNQRWVTDISYVWTDEGWCYLAVILDLFSRSVVGWALSPSLSTELPLAALQMAVGRRRLKAGLLHHSDRGCQYTSADYRAVLAELGVTVSMSRKGNCWDNAVAESFFATLKNELVHTRSWPTRLELRAQLFEYIEVFYNRRRLHSSLDYYTPAEVENLYAAQAA
jgi:transposase InsO family protein